MVPVQWTDFSETSDTLEPIPVREVLPAAPIVTVRRSGLPLTPAAEFLLDLLRRHLPPLAIRPKAGRLSAAPDQFRTQLDPFGVGLNFSATPFMQ